jgi:hypothetical protein
MYVMSQHTAQLLFVIHISNTLLNYDTAWYRILPRMRHHMTSL